MSKFSSILQYFKQHIPQKYRLVAFLVTTSFIGILLIFLAVYNTSKDLELIHDVDNLHRFAKASLSGTDQADDLVQALTNQSHGDYKVMILDSNDLVQQSDNAVSGQFPMDVNHLEQSRVNERGGYMESGEGIYTWVKLPINSNKQVIVMHRFVGTPLNQLVSLYLKRLLVPAIFYIWLMVWVGLIIRFLTDRLVAQNKELERMALYDGLTGLPNRVLLNDRLQKLIQACQRNQRRFALAVIDLNKFKAVNDNFGHDQGDELLCQVANRISKLLRTSDTVARIGGDEFVLLLNDTDENSCLYICEQIQSELLNSYLLREGEVNIGLSVGIAMYPEHGCDSITLMRKADLAMYAIKSNGGGIQLYAESEAQTRESIASAN